MRFLDSSIFLHAYLKPKKKLTPAEKSIKKAAKNILTKIEKGEEVFTTVVHLSEILNIVESRIGLKQSISLLARILSLQNISITNVNIDDYKKALLLADKYNISINDALAYIKMKENNIKEIYTFDKHFKNLPKIKTIQITPLNT